MEGTDLIGVAAVEQACYDYPWSRRIFEDCLRVGYCCLVAERDDVICGHGIMLVSAGEAHILNLCVDPAHRRQGVARTLLAELLGMAVRLGAAEVYLEVRPSNEGAIRLYRDNGFRLLGRRPEYYPAAFGREDALVMGRDLGR